MDENVTICIMDEVICDIVFCGIVYMGMEACCMFVSKKIGHGFMFFKFILSFLMHLYTFL